MTRKFGKEVQDCRVRFIQSSEGLTSIPQRGLMYVGCSDGSVVEWMGRAAIRRVVPPANKAHPPPKEATDVLVHTVAGNGVIFVVYRSVNGGDW